MGVKALRELEERWLTGAEPPPRLSVVFCEEWEAECMADYHADCVANPNWQMPSYEEYREDWLDVRLHDEARAADVEAAEERAAERAMALAELLKPAPMRTPCGDTDEDIPF